MATITRTVMSGIQHGEYVSVDSVHVIPVGITRYGVGSRVEVRSIRSGRYAVQPVEGDPLRIFGEETWHVVSA